MASFDFQTLLNAQAFKGSLFYNTYKNSALLRVEKNVETILCHGSKIKEEVDKHPVGDSVPIKGLNLENKGGEGVNIGDLEFTYNRLVGLVAAYAFDNRTRFHKIEISDAKSLGLEWDNGNEDKCRLYLSALYGTKNMIDQFSYFPLLCALRKFQMGKLSAQNAAGLGKVKNNEGETMMKVMKKDLARAKRMWKMFPKAKVSELTALLEITPEFKSLYQG